MLKIFYYIVHECLIIIIWDMSKHLHIKLPRLIFFTEACLNIKLNNHSAADT